MASFVEKINTIYCRMSQAASQIIFEFYIGSTVGGVAQRSTGFRTSLVSGPMLNWYRTAKEVYILLAERSIIFIVSG